LRTVNLIIKPCLYHDSGMFYKNVDFCWRVSDCEELEGVTQRKWWGKDANKCFQKQGKYIRAWVVL